jgi:hypothetical protein
VRFIPGWLHCRLLGYRWYRRKCGIPERSTDFEYFMKEVLQALEESFRKSIAFPEMRLSERQQKHQVRSHVPTQYVARPE